MIDAILEVVGYGAVLLFVFGAAYAWDKLEVWVRKKKGARR